jgi:hypothetical protein
VLLLCHGFSLPNDHRPACIRSEGAHHTFGAVNNCLKPAELLLTGHTHQCAQVLGDHLKPSEAANCRLASRLLAQVAPDRAATRLWVVANSFAAQLEADGRGTTAAGAAGLVDTPRADL